MGADRRVAGGVERADELALGRHARGRLWIRHRRQQLGRDRSGAGLDRERSLTGRGHELHEHATGLVSSAEPLEAREREHDRVELALGELAQPGVDVAAHADHLEVAADGADLCRAPQAAGADGGAGRELGQRARAADRIMRIRPLGNRDSSRPSGS